MTNDKNLKNKITNVKWLVPFALIPAVANASEGGGLSPSTLWTGIALVWIVAGVLTARNAKQGLTVVGIFGVLVSFYLGQQHFSDAPALCDAGNLYSCSTVNSSEYSELFGFPIALLGLGHFAAMVVLANLHNDKEKEYSSVGALLFATSVLSVLYSIVLAFISKSVIGAWCLFCISLYGLNAIGLFGAWKLKQGNSVGMFAGKSLSTAAMIFIATVGGSFMVIAPSGYVGSNSEIVAGSVDIASLIEELSTPLPLDGSEPVMGDRQASIQLVEFADFECPHCAMVAPQLKDLLASNTKVNLRFKHYPISNICNPNVGAEGHVNACLAATATDCALKQGKFWEMSTIVFKNQSYLSRKDIEFMAEAQVKLDMPQFKTCLDDPAMVKGIQSDVSAAEAIGVTGTPSIYIKGVANTEKWYKVTGTVVQLKSALAGLE
jgi:protein-disulfide isomerase/uncharacterized membrane protein